MIRVSCLVIFGVLSGAAAIKESDGNQRTPYIQNLKFSKMASFNPSMNEPNMGGGQFSSPFGDPAGGPGGSPGIPDSPKATQLRARMKRQAPSDYSGNQQQQQQQQLQQISRAQILTVLADIIQKQKEVARDTSEVIKVLKNIGLDNVESKETTTTASSQLAEHNSKESLKAFLTHQMGKYANKQNKSHNNLPEDEAHLESMDGLGQIVPDNETKENNVLKSIN